MYIGYNPKQTNITISVNSTVQNGKFILIHRSCILLLIFNYIVTDKSYYMLGWVLIQCISFYCTCICICIEPVTEIN